MKIRRHLLACLLLFWEVLGLQLSYAKGSIGSSIPWIGAMVTVQRQRHPSGLEWPGVMVTLQRTKMEELQSNVNEIFGARGMVNLKLVRTIAGQISWASGIFYWLKSFNACLWSALTTHVNEQCALAVKPGRARKRPTDLMFTARISQAIAWIRALLMGLIKDAHGKVLPVQRWRSLAHRCADCSYTIRSDASPFGMGAILLAGNAPVSWCAQAWTDADRALFGAVPGDPAWQAEWELLAILMAVDVWLPLLKDEAAFVGQSDATAALFASKRGAGRTPAMNALCAEIAIRVESAMMDFRLEHYEAVINFEADALSRLSQGTAIPARLRDLPQQHLRPRSASFFWAWPRELIEGR
jgi:hypothetical protein